MSGRIILNSEIINEINIYLETKFQRGNGKNYYFVPNIGLELYNAKVSWIDKSKKNISFSFNRYDNLTLLNMLKYINSKLSIIYEKKSNDPMPISTFFYEKGDNFYIRCYLPNTRGNYHIDSFFNNESEKFSIPNLSSVYNNITIDIRNIWEDLDNNRAGYNLELKKTSLTIM